MGSFKDGTAHLNKPILHPNEYTYCFLKFWGRKAQLHSTFEVYILAFRKTAPKFLLCFDNLECHGYKSVQVI